MIPCFLQLQHQVQISATRRIYILVHQLHPPLGENSLSGSWMRFPEFSWRLAFGLLQSSTPDGTVIALPLRKILVSSAKPDNAGNSSICIWLNILPLHVTMVVVNLSNTPLDDATH
jgi:hypothetical protein